MKKDTRLVIIGSVAIDSVETPFGKRDDILGGSATYSGISASFFNKNTAIVAVVGRDFPDKYREALAKRGVNIDGLETADGKTFRWKGNYAYDLNAPVTVYTHLNVFSDFKPKIPRGMETAPYLFLANID
ncbi:MAG: sugar kinase, partial [Candidatus Omnitrophota bacterium]